MIQAGWEGGGTYRRAVKRLGEHYLFFKWPRIESNNNKFYEQQLSNSNRVKITAAGATVIDFPIGFEHEITTT